MEKKQEHPAIEQLNRLAEECYELRQAGKTSEFDNKFTRLSNCFLSLMLQTQKSKYPSFNELEALIYEVFEEQWGFNNGTEGWNPSMPPFYQASCSMLKLRFINKQNKLKKFGVPVDMETGPFVHESDGKASASEQIEVQSTVVYIFDLMNDTVQYAITHSPNKFCYPQRFYTELVAKTVQSHAASVRDIPARTENCIDLAFADSFLEEQIGSLPDLAGARLKSLRSFTGKDADEKTPCGYDLRTVVYQAYIEAATGKRPNDSAISQQRSKFKDLLQAVRAKI